MTRKVVALDSTDGAARDNRALQNKLTALTPPDRTMADACNAPHSWAQGCGAPLPKVARGRS